MRRLVTLLAMAALIGATVATVDAAGANGPRARAMKLRLKPFNSCTRLVKYARRHAPREIRYSGGPVVAPGSPPAFTEQPTDSSGGGRGEGDGGTPTAAPQSPDSAGGGDSSQTNVQEAGVDEPDIVKSDGKTIFAIGYGRLNAVDARAATPKLLSSLELPFYGGDMLLAGKRLIVISYAPSPVEVAPQQGGPEPDRPARGAQAQDDPAIAPGEPSPGYYRPATLITEIDVSDPADMKVLKTETVDGNYVSARLNGSTARIVISTPPAYIDYGQPTPLRAKARGWLPRARFENKVTGRKRTRQLTGCRHVRRPRVFAGLDVLTVLTVDMKKGLPAVDTDALMTDGQTVYASNDSLYVATQRFLPPPADGGPPPPITTAIHKFDISDRDATAYRASGETPGYVLGQFALSEYKGVLRVASTSSPVWWPGAPREETQSYVSTLSQAGNVLLPLGRVGGLGQGERITGVRFIDDAGFVVTFRQTDPLYTVDLSKPNDPTVAGELKLLGFSAYLHPVADGLLLGVGQDATPEGRQLGTQLSLFDVSDLAKPERLRQARVGGASSSEAEYDHHAFLYWGPEKLAVLPVSIYDGRSNPFNGAIGFRVGRSKIEEVGRISHDQGEQYAPGIRRSVVVGERLFTISDAGAEASGLSSLNEQAWVPFPVPQGSGGGSAGSDGGAPAPNQSSPPSG
jgi:hypothetical protein